MSAPARVWIDTRHDVELRDVLNAIRGRLQSSGSLAWLSHRTLCHKVLFRGNSRVLELVDELVARGYIRRVTAPGRGHGKGRTLYWLPKARKTAVLRELRRERMPHAAIVAAIGFFVEPKNAPGGEQPESLRSSTSGTQSEKGTRAALAQRSRSPGEPPLRVLPPPPRLSAPPSLGRLSKHGWTPAPAVETAARIAELLKHRAQLPRITEDPATHPEFCECSDCLSRRPSS